MSQPLFKADLEKLAEMLKKQYRVFNEALLAQSKQTQGQPLDAGNCPEEPSDSPLPI